MTTTTLTTTTLATTMPIAPDPESIDGILEERGSRYGDFLTHADITQDIKQAMLVGNWSRLASFQKEALEMIAHKIGRILNGDPDYLDSWVDIVGYTQLVVNQLRLAEDLKHLDKNPTYTSAI